MVFVVFVVMFVAVVAVVTVITAVVPFAVVGGSIVKWVETQPEKSQASILRLLAIYQVVPHCPKITM